MGMDYCWTGSASYRRFNEELSLVAKIFGGTKADETKFSFPEGTNEVLIRWFNDIYGDFTVEETKIIWRFISKHPEIEEVSWQIWEELKHCVEFYSSWFIY